MILSGTVPARMTEQSLLQKPKLCDLVNVHCSEPCKNVLSPSVHHPEDALEFSDPERTKFKKKKKKLQLNYLPQGGRRDKLGKLRNCGKDECQLYFNIRMIRIFQTSYNETH